ncbi:MAG: 16S rRNA (adenine(1518)-N(6)/adenine(1519)-N(6))-dimethyltransferase RsmA [Betaproteobacteria bacterium]|nr:16S rRNA (adenine(1518)-N(6)/adenine(1519)-N(6))-dimethyltransferase RsmA [Betaproteobacteria bacterium]NBY05266.1 16S rRNA (adenine(1518)-N(6)/adenine(1519)-N(6))-dimethyltransferase RsmA [Betaproteobacteria bacterium]
MAHPNAPRKRFGQHFLTDHAVIEDIVNAVDPRAGQIMVEIGPGWAALSQPLVERLGHLQVIEIDRDLARELRGHAQLSVIEADVLQVNFSDLAQRLQAPQLRVVGNLPYNISTPILFHLFDHVAVVQDQHFMLQKEVVERMVATPHSADYGRLSVMMQARYQMEKVLDVAPEAFHPPPKVDSAVVRMWPVTQEPDVPWPVLSELVRVAFGQRRKLLRHTLGAWLTQQGVASGFDLQRRAQEVSVAEFVALAGKIAETLIKRRSANNLH